MYHIRFMNAGQTVCDAPNLLGTDFLLIEQIDYDEPGCLKCTELLLDYESCMNQEENEEPSWSYPHLREDYQKPYKDSPMFIWGVLSLCLAVLMLIIVSLMF